VGNDKRNPEETTVRLSILLLCKAIISFGKKGRGDIADQSCLESFYDERFLPRTISIFAVKFFIISANIFSLVAEAIDGP
jgi:hypothetical protein